MSLRGVVLERHDEASPWRRGDTIPYVVSDVASGCGFDTDFVLLNHQHSQ
jgi:hypothetical protein